MNGAATQPLLDLDFMSHGTLLMDDLARSRRFYEEFLGLEVVRTSEISLAIRLNSATSVACVALSKKVRRPGREYLRYYNLGLSVGTPADVVDSRKLALEHQAGYEIREIGEIEESDGRVSFLIGDRDGNFWDIHSDRPGAAR